MLVLAQVGCALAGGLCLFAAAVFDLEFVRTHLAADGVLTPDQAAVLPLARLTLAGFGAALLGLAPLLPRLGAARWWTGLVSSRRRLEWAIFLVPPGLLLGLVGYKLLRGPRDPLYLLAVREDSLVEWLTALAYLAAVVVCWVLVRRFLRARRRPLAAFHALLGACCLFVALEEISYGQRLAGFATPEPVAAHNVQHEMTLHNLDFADQAFFTLAPLAVGLFGLLGWVLPGLRHRLGRRRVELLSFLVPSWFLASWFVPIALFALYAALFWGRATVVEWQDQEPLEALLAFGFLAFLVDNLARLRREEAPAAWGPEQPREGR